MDHTVLSTPEPLIMVLLRSLISHECVRRDAICLRKVERWRGGDILHEDILAFRPAYLSENDDICIGKERCIWVLSRVSDWERLQRFEAPDDILNPPFELAMFGTYTTCIHYQSLKCDNIELYSRSGEPLRVLTHRGADCTPPPPVQVFNLVTTDKER
jgi:hypothetical protein